MPTETPLATYRIQFTSAFGFDAAANYVPYLKQLGITHLYASPFMKARPGSTHGYDIVDHASLNPEFGGEDAFARLSEALAAADLGLILDFVPNHMGVGGADNEWWLDVLEWGQRSPHAASFDIDWETLPYRHEGGVLLPILGRPYGDALEQGEIVLKYDPAEGSFSAYYYEHRLPIRPHRYSEILRTVVAAAGATNDPSGRALLDLADRYPDPREPSREEAPAFKAAIAAVSGGAAIIARGLVAYQPQPDDHARVVALHRLLERQHYRIAFWRVAGSEINYRRFFDVNDLAGIRVEDPRTFDATHRLVGQLIAEGRLHGLRIDHIDGLQDPAQYCRRLQRLIRDKRGPQARPFYVVVEKILSDREAMPKFPGVAGTTGYEWLNVITRVLVDERGLAALDDTRIAITGNDRGFDEILMRAKRRVLDNLLSSEFTVLTRLLGRIAAGHWSTRDYTIDRLRAALELFVLYFPVYRTYVTSAGPSAADRATIRETIATARTRWFGSDVSILDLLQDALTLDLIGRGRTGYSAPRVRRFAFKVQQFTGPMMAKSLEDTAFYRYTRLLAMNEVGGDPAAAALPVAEFHHRMAGRVKNFPQGMTATATHDTKRGEDARARIMALSEIPEDWRNAVTAWHALNERHIDRSRTERAPSAGHEYLIYQALAGAWPLAGADETFSERMQAYAIKAAREGKVETSWLNPDEAYEAALTGFVGAILDRARSPEFIAASEVFIRRVALLGALNSLSQLALKAMVPGVPDIYQGTEFWDLSLVDPDNRRPVDFDARAAALAELEAPDWRALAEQWQDGRIKLALTRKLLALRTRLAPVFQQGAYLPIEVRGTHRDHVVAFARRHDRDAVIVAVGRHMAPLTGNGVHWPHGGEWDATLAINGFQVTSDHLEPERKLPRAEVPVAVLFGDLPVAVLRARQSSAAARAGKGRVAAVPIAAA
jgi:(1->4)-alpha-D-glucan 1-alpha-D-glucosylmutase